MGFIRMVLGLVIVLAIIVFGYWLYATYTMASPRDEIWVKINSNLPAPLRQWSCKEVRKRAANAEAPAGCKDAWK